MELLLNALVSVVIESSKEADLAVNYGINTPVYERQCFGRDEIKRLECEKEIKKDKENKQIPGGNE